MAEIWGYKWTSQFGAVATQDSEWSEMLLSLSMQEIFQGLEAEKHSNEEWPSAIPVFRRNAKQGSFNFDLIFNTCINWSSDDQLKMYGLERTRETLFIMRKIGAELKKATAAQAEKLVRGAIEALEKHLADGNELPDWPKAEIEEFPRGEPKGFCMADFEKLLRA